MSSTFLGREMSLEFMSCHGHSKEHYWCDLRSKHPSLCFVFVFVFTPPELFPPLHTTCILEMLLTPPQPAHSPTHTHTHTPSPSSGGREGYLLDDSQSIILFALFHSLSYFFSQLVERFSALLNSTSFLSLFLFFLFANTSTTHPDLQQDLLLVSSFYSPSCFHLLFSVLY